MLGPVTTTAPWTFGLNEHLNMLEVCGPVNPILIDANILFLSHYQKSRSQSGSPHKVMRCYFSFFGEKQHETNSLAL
jgi:hypothetical protein